MWTSDSPQRGHPMSATAIFDSNNLQHGDSDEIISTDIAPRYSHLERSLTSFSDTTLATLLRKLSKLYGYNDMPESRPHTILYHADSFIFSPLLSVKSPRDSGQSYDIVHCILPNSSSSYWPVVRTKSAQQQRYC